MRFECPGHTRCLRSGAAVRSKLISGSLHRNGRAQDITFPLDPPALARVDTCLRIGCC